MKKTVKTLINTSLLTLFVSHSYGLVLNLADAYNQTGVADDLGLILLDGTTHSEFNGIDNTFDGRITFNFTIAYDLHTSGANNVALFPLYIRTFDAPIAIGSSKSDKWNGIRIENFGSTGLTFGSNPVVVGQPKAFTMTIDYNAGALDTGTLLIAGDSTVYDIGDYDYSFDEILFNVSPDCTASATNMKVSIVPEPKSYALICGALALVFVPLRRRFNA